MPRNDPTPPGSFSSMGQVSDMSDNMPATPPKGVVMLCLLSGATVEVYVDHESTVELLRSKAKLWLKREGSDTETNFDIIYKDRVLDKVHRKLYDVAMCYEEGEPPPVFTIVRK